MNRQQVARVKRSETRGQPIDPSRVTLRFTRATAYAVQIGPDLIVIDAFQKKSKSGIKTPQVDVDRIKERIKRLKEALR
jgi:phage-related protein